MGVVRSVQILIKGNAGGKNPAATTTIEPAQHLLYQRARYISETYRENVETQLMSSMERLTHFKFSPKDNHYRHIR